ncbi:MAG: FAD-dependent monooxygenase, partial [Armatimonadaceae bacterium]
MSLQNHVDGLDPTGFLETTVTHLRHSWKGKDPVLAPMLTANDSPSEVWMVMRPKFDHYLQTRAESEGATVILGGRVTQVVPDASGVEVTTDDGTVHRSRYVVGADGAKGVVGARVGLRLNKRWGIAREAEIPFDDATPENPWHPQLEPAACYLDYGTVKNGYAWIFPKLGILSVGAGMLTPKKPTPAGLNTVAITLLNAMKTQLVSAGLSPDLLGDDIKIWAHPIPYWTGNEPIVDQTGRVMLVGDAAGLVQPLFGEGIQYTVRSGAEAARHILADRVDAYADAIKAMFGGEFDRNQVDGFVHFQNGDVGERIARLDFRWYPSRFGCSRFLIG